MKRPFQWLPAALLLAAWSGLASSKTPPPDTLERRLLACTACHGEQGRAGTDAYYPRVAGKPAGYLYNQLINFREGRRHYPLMAALLDPLSDDYLREIAGHFAGQHPPYPAPKMPQVSAAVLERGRQLALSGDPAREVPACVDCHGATLGGRAPAIPGLVGLPRDYLNAQFGAWQTGLRRAAAPDCMAAIARKLSPDDVSAVSAWLSAQPVSQRTAIEREKDDLPMPCGSAVRQERRP